MQALFREGEGGGGLCKGRGVGVCVRAGMCLGGDQ